jgi:cysteine-rich repeat protein
VLFIINMSMAGVLVVVEPVSACHGTIMVRKATSPYSASVPFDFSGSGPNGWSPVFSLSDGEYHELSFSRTGSYTISESMPAGWAMADVVCEGPYGYTVDATSSEVTLKISGDGSATCTFYNSDTTCQLCDGKVTDLTLVYTGAAASRVEVKQRDGAVVYNENTDPGGVFSVSGQDNQNTLGPEIDIYVGGVFNANFHTSCSEPIGPGTQSGDFTVLSGESRNGGILCPVCGYCGDGVRDGAEQCDDGNYVDTDSCRNDCTYGLKPTPVNTCTGAGTLYAYYNDPFQPIDNAFATGYDQLLIFHRPDYVDSLNVLVNGSPVVPDTVADYTSPFKVRIYGVNTAPGDTIAISGSGGYGARGIQGYLAQNAASPAYEASTFQVITMILRKTRCI